MDNKPSIDRELLFPILIGGFSIVGIVVVLVIGRAMNSPAAVAATPSATPFQYVYLGTEPAISTPLFEGSEIAPPFEVTSDDAPSIDETPILATSTNSASVSTPLVLPTLNATNTAPPSATSASGPPLNPGTYDDIDSHFVYSGSWDPTRVTGAYANTLQVSTTPGSTITFRFIGREMRLFYQGGNTLGEMRITIDNVTDTLDQSEGSEWVSDVFANGTHTVVITHVGGGSVNLDYVIIPEVPTTATPSATPTATQNQ